MLDFGGSYNSATVFKHIVMSHNGSWLNGFALVFVCVCVRLCDGYRVYTFLLG